MEHLRRLVPPLISAAVLGILWNRWTTARRFQQVRGCVLGCPPRSSDSVEHYAYCPALRQAAHSHLGLQWRTWPHGLADFLLALPLAQEPSQLARQALFAYAAYAVTSAICHPSHPSPDDAPAMLNQALWEDESGHRALSQ